MSSFRQSIITTFRNCLRAPLDQLSTFEILAEERRGFETLQQLVHIECRLFVVEPNHDSDRDHRVRERIHEASAECVLRQRPSESVNYCVEWFLGFPDLLYAQCKNLW